MPAPKTYICRGRYAVHVLMTFTWHGRYAEWAVRVYPHHLRCYNSCCVSVPFYLDSVSSSFSFTTAQGTTDRLYYHMSPLVPLLSPIISNKTHLMIRQISWVLCINTAEIIALSDRKQIIPRASPCGLLFFDLVPVMMLTVASYLVSCNDAMKVNDVGWQMLPHPFLLWERYILWFQIALLYVHKDVVDWG